MAFIEFTRKSGYRFLIDFASGWEINERPGSEPALWVNDQQARNLDCRETYDQVRAKLLPDACAAAIEQLRVK